MLRVGCGAGFLGDNLDAPRRLAELSNLDVLTLEYLAELTLSILARQRDRDPGTGYARDFDTVLESLTPSLSRQPRLTIVTNAGGMNPHACARSAARILAAAGLGDRRVAAIAGDDLLPWLEGGLSGSLADQLTNLDDGRSFRDLADRVVSANVYLGAEPIAEALAQQADVVVTGRVADAALTVGPAVHAFGWSWEDWDRLAGATVAGHLIECGAQVTGGYSVDWSSHSLEDVGYPFVEMEPSGAAVVGKPAELGGAVNRLTVTEQLVYEIGDPSGYLTPDVIADFTTVEIEETAADRVRVTGARGRPKPPTLKASIAYRDGYMTSGQLLVYGVDAESKARAAAQLLLDRVQAAGFAFERVGIELLGTGDGVPGRAGTAGPSRELMLRIAVHDPRREAVERFSKEFAPLITSGPAGLAGYAVGRSPVRQVYAYWPAAVPRDLVQPTVHVRSATEWCDGAGESEGAPA